MTSHMPTSEIGEDTNSETCLGEVGVVLTNKSKSEILNTTGGSSSAGFECERAYDVDNCMIEKVVGRDGETMFKLHLQKFNSDAELLTLLCKLDWESEDYLVAVDAFKNQIQGPMELMQTVHCRVGSTNIGFNINQVESIQDLKKQAVTKADDAIGEWGIFLRTLEKYAESKEWRGSYTQLRAIKGGKRTRFRCEIDGLPMSNWDRLVGQSVRFDSNNHGERYRAFAEVIQSDPEAGTADFEILSNENDVRVINGLGNLGSISYQDIGTVEECRRQRNAIDRLLKGESKSKGWLKDFLFSASKPVGIKSEAVQKPDQIANFLEPRLNQVQQNAVELATSTEDFALIQGPPGTGKTTVIAEICYQLAKQGKKVLVASQANMAVDNALSRLQKSPEIMAYRDISSRKLQEGKVEDDTFIGENAVRVWLEGQAEYAKNKANRLSLMSKLKLAISSGLSLETLLNSKSEVPTALEIKELERFNLKNGSRSPELDQLELAFKYQSEIGVNPKEYFSDGSEVISPSQIAGLKEHLSILQERKSTYESKLAIQEEDLQVLKRSPKKIWLLRLIQEINRFFLTETLGIELGKRKSNQLKNELVALHKFDSQNELQTRVESDLDYRKKRVMGKAKETQIRQDLELSIQEEEILSERLGYFDLWSQNLMSKRGSTKIGLFAQVIRQINQLKRGSSNCIGENLRSIFDEFPGHTNPKVLQDQSSVLQKWTMSFDTKRVLNAEMVNLFYKLVNVVGATCSHSGSKDFLEKHSKFDVVIIDEVSKATPTELLIPAILGEKLILVGDHKQLPPTPPSRDLEATFEDLNNELDISYEELSEKVAKSLFKSRFQEFCEPGRKSKALMLTTQYRMHPDIMTGVNQFYGGQLNDGTVASRIDREHGLTGSSVVAKDTNHVVWVNSRSLSEYETGTKSKRNIKQAELTLAVVKDLIDSGAESKDIGLITPYAGQLRLYRSLWKKFKLPSDLLFSTVDRFQGTERKFVVVDLVFNSKRAKPSSFLRSHERINVAFSRAQSVLVVVGSSASFTKWFGDDTPYSHFYEVARRTQGLVSDTEVLS